MIPHCPYISEKLVDVANDIPMESPSWFRTLFLLLLEYASVVEYGTQRAYKVRVKNVKVLYNSKTKQFFGKEVTIPPRKAKPFFEPSIQESIKRLERQQYLNSQEFRDKIAAWEKRKENMSFREWVQENTSIGRSRGGTCIRPDVFLSLNDHACNDCPYYEHCMCYQKRLSHEKRKRKQR